MAEKFVFEQRDYQAQAVDTALTHYQRGMESVLIESPVGSGKTIMGLMTIQALQKQNPDLRVNWVASRRHILEQTERVNLEYFHCNITPVSVFNNNPPPADLVVLDKDPTAVPSMEIKDIQVLRTIKDGKTIFSA